jgi:hypothetical protein
MLALAAATLAALNPIVAHDSHESSPLSPAGRPAEAVFAQHSGAERCGWSSVTIRDGRPVVFAAHGSHASYLVAGTRDRLWPDPNDEADGRGLVVRPRLVEITRSSPPWMQRSTPAASSATRWASATARRRR